MSKTRKGRAPNLPPAAFNAPIAAVPAAIGTGAKSATKAVTARAIDWHAEYGEVLHDLKKTALIAVVLIAAMVALSFVV